MKWCYFQTNRWYVLWALPLCLVVDSAVFGTETWHLCVFKYFHRINLSKLLAGLEPAKVISLLSIFVQNWSQLWWWWLLLVLPANICGKSSNFFSWLLSKWHLPNFHSHGWKNTLFGRCVPRPCHYQQESASSLPMWLLDISAQLPSTQHALPHTSSPRHAQMAGCGCGSAQYRTWTLRCVMTTPSTSPAMTSPWAAWALGFSRPSPAVRCGNRRSMTTGGASGRWCAPVTDPVLSLSQVEKSQKKEGCFVFVRWSVVHVSVGNKVRNMSGQWKMCGCQATCLAYKSNLFLQFNNTIVFSRFIRWECSFAQLICT